MYLFSQFSFMIKVWPQSWFVIKYLRAVFENVHISISIPFHSLNIWEKGFWKCTHSVLSFIVGNISVDFCSSLKIPLTFQSTFFLKLHCLLWFHWIIALLFICFIHYSFACVSFPFEVKIGELIHVCWTYVGSDVKRV